MVKTTLTDVMNEASAPLFVGNAALIHSFDNGFGAKLSLITTSIGRTFVQESKGLG
ncbi:MAG: hypothetical protein ACI8ZB_004294 [Desulforhopalus sp.]|jgi:hypothetical protein